MNREGRLASQRDYIAPDDEEGILRAATEIRQRRKRSGPASSSRRKRRLGQSSTESGPGR